MKFTMPKGIAKVATKAVFALKKECPTIAVVAGVVGVVAGTVMAVCASKKGEEVIAEHKEKLDIVETLKNEAGEETDKYRKEIVRTYIHTGVELVKTYGPAVACEAAGLAAIIFSHCVLKGRATALSTAYAALGTSFKNYKEKVKDVIGEDAEKKLAYDVEKKVIDIPQVNEDGTTTTESKEVEVSNSLDRSPYAKFFDELSDQFDPKDRSYNLEFLQTAQRMMNDTLRHRYLVRGTGVLFLNEVYDKLGIPRTKQGQLAGWVMDDEHKDVAVDFGIYDIRKPENRAFVNGWEPAILLDFNCDANIVEFL